METSGFFQAMMDSETGNYDRKYLASQFAKYFSLFVKNGVFGSPTDQLLVVPGEGLSLVVKPGHAFINGYWYENDSDKVIPLVPNYGAANRTDTVRVRMSHVTRDMTVDVYTDDTELERGEDVYDLQLAAVTVQPMAQSVPASAIQDTRPNEELCGFVTGLLSVQTTADLFAQYQSMFDEWFEDVKGTLSEDAAGNLLLRMDDLEEQVDAFKEEVSQEVATAAPISSVQRIYIGSNNSSYWTGKDDQYVFGHLPSNFSMPTEWGIHVFIEILYGVDGSYSTGAVCKTTGPLRLLGSTIQKFRLEGFVEGYGYFSREVSFGLGGNSPLEPGMALNVGPVKKITEDNWNENDSARDNVIVPRYAFLTIDNKIVTSSGQPWS